MKKSIVVTYALMLFAGTILTSCKKENASAENTGVTNDLQVGNNSSCKLTHNDWPDIFTWDFHYNDKGLADEWRIAYPYGYVQNFKLKYDRFNKLSKADAYDDFDNLIFTDSFTYSGNRLVSLKWADLLAGADGDVLFTYNSKGQIIREDDGGTHQDMTYDNMGNCIRADYYDGTYFYFSDRYTFENNVRNPLLTVSGVDFMFPYAGVGFFNKLWFTNNLSIFYDTDGTEYVLNDFDVSQTVFTTNQQNFPTSANYYNKISQGPLDLTFGYSCNGSDNFTNQGSAQSNNAMAANKPGLHQGPMLLRMGSAKSMRARVTELVKQMKAQQQSN